MLKELPVEKLKNDPKGKIAAKILAARDVYTIKALNAGHNLHLSLLETVSLRTRLKINAFYEDTTRFVRKLWTSIVGET